ncbi:tRNA (guanine(37)-N1)-methyltransferase [Trichomonascus vanleenenianus]|uniref:tRNA (guanine) methyltransferase n=1 Tax=Trichomonascus vanleenenianus TaxID=2268995 RepID=UPI003ECA3760
MKELDRDIFKTKVPLIAAKLGDPSYITRINKEAKKDLLQLQGVSRVVTVDETKGLLLRDDIKDPASVYNSISEQSAELFKMANSSFVPYTLELGYEYWKSDEILSAVLPEELLDEIPSGFTNVGHIAHMNIREEYMPYRFLIGEVILDKNPLIKTVVNKLDSIDTVYRTFDMEVLAGEEKFDVEQAESGCRFRFNFKKVYWNTRLHTEHDRLIKKFQKGQAVCDVMAGVGPFAVPAGKKGVIVLANDLNPDSYAALEENVRINRVSNFVVPYNMDGLKFIKEASSRLVDWAEEKEFAEIVPKKVSRTKPSSTPIEKVVIPKSFSHYVMNLPDSAIEFLPGFVGLYADIALRKRVFGTESLTEENMPVVHVHCFHKSDPMQPEPQVEEMYEDMRKRVAKNLNFDIPLEALSFHRVRKVAPTKTMFCISFKLPLEVALA